MARQGCGMYREVCVHIPRPLAERGWVSRIPAGTGRTCRSLLEIAVSKWRQPRGVRAATPDFGGTRFRRLLLACTRGAGMRVTVCYVWQQRVPAGQGGQHAHRSHHAAHTVREPGSALERLEQKRISRFPLSPSFKAHSIQMDATLRAPALPAWLQQQYFCFARLPIFRQQSQRDRHQWHICRSWQARLECRRHRYFFGSGRLFQPTTHLLQTESHLV